MKSILFIVIVAAAAVTNCKDIPSTEGLYYDGYQVVSVVPSTENQLKFLKNLQNEFDFWKLPGLGNAADILASPAQQQDLFSQFKTVGLDYKIKIKDVGSLLSSQHPRNVRASSNNTFDQMNWKEYRTFKEIETYLLSLNKSNEITLSSIGKSTEGREIYLAVISSGQGSNGNPKPVIYIDANIHAREWITSAVATWIINELTTKAAKYSSLLDQFDFYIVPVLNPDGYAYTWSNNRMWRKTRSVSGANTCKGADPNRNFEFQFGGESTSDNPCSDQYKGESAFSEPETRALRDSIQGLMKNDKNRIFAYYSLHSYGQLWLLSWGYTKSAYPSDYDELYRWGKLSTEAIYKAHKREYTYGQGADILYGVGGASDDWAKYQGIKYVTTVEVRDRDGGPYGFLLPPAQIIPTAEEVWQGIQVIGEISQYRNNGRGTSYVAQHILRVLPILVCLVPTL